MALPDDHEDPDEHATGPLLPPDDRLWRHPSELRSHPITPLGTLPPAPPQSGGDGGGNLRGALAAACLAGVVLMASALWVTWPRQTPGPAGGSLDALADDPPTGRDLQPDGDDVHPVAATNTSSRIFELLPPTASIPDAEPPARLGVQVVDLVMPMAGLLSSWGAAEVVEVDARSAAERFGLLPGDLITAVGSRPVASAGDLVEAVQRHQPGDEVDLRVIRRGDSLTITVQLGD